MLLDCDWESAHKTGRFLIDEARRNRYSSHFHRMTSQADDSLLNAEKILRQKGLGTNEEKAQLAAILMSRYELHRVVAYSSSKGQVNTTVMQEAVALRAEVFGFHSKEVAESLLALAYVSGAFSRNTQDISKNLNEALEVIVALGGTGATEFGVTACDIADRIMAAAEGLITTYDQFIRILREKLPQERLALADLLYCRACCNFYKVEEHVWEEAVAASQSQGDPARYARCLKALALRQQSSWQPQEALKNFMQFMDFKLQTEPLSFQAYSTDYLHLSGILEQNSDLINAEEALQTLVDLSLKEEHYISELNARNWIAAFYEKHGQWEESIPHLARLITWDFCQNPHRQEVAYRLICSYMRTGQYDKALLWTSKIVRFGAQNGRVPFMHALCLVKTKRFDEAQELIQQLESDTVYRDVHCAVKRERFRAIGDKKNAVAMDKILKQMMEQSRGGCCVRTIDDMNELNVTPVSS